MIELTQELDLCKIVGCVCCLFKGLKRHINIDELWHASRRIRLPSTLAFNPVTLSPVKKDASKKAVSKAMPPAQPLLQFHKLH